MLCFKRFLQILGVLGAFALNSKIIYHQGEHNGAPLVMPETSSLLSWLVSEFFDALGEEVFGKFFSLG